MTSRINMLLTPRLRLRQWRAEDAPAFARLNATPAVMRYFPALLSETESYQLMDKFKHQLTCHGWGIWAVELVTTAEFIGCVGLHHCESGIPHAPLTEICWRLLPEHWRQGYATEAARCAIDFAFSQQLCNELYAFTAIINQPSQGVMMKVGMENTGEIFHHPGLTKQHELSKHCLYRITRQNWPQRAVSEPSV